MIRNKTHIFRIMTLLFKVWVRNPNLRFCQLIQNCFRSSWANKDEKIYYGQGKDIYYEEDKELERRLREVYLRGDSNGNTNKNTKSKF